MHRQIVLTAVSSRHTLSATATRYGETLAAVPGLGHGPGRGAKNATLALVFNDEPAGILDVSQLLTTKPKTLYAFL